MKSEGEGMGDPWGVGPVGWGYPWDKGGCRAMGCEGWWVSMEQWVHTRGYSHSCLQVLGPPSHPSPRGGHGSQAGPGWRAMGR